MININTFHNKNTNSKISKLLYVSVAEDITRDSLGSEQIRQYIFSNLRMNSVIMHLYTFMQSKEFLLKK